MDDCLLLEVARPDVAERSAKSFRGWLVCPRMYTIHGEFRLCGRLRQRRRKQWAWQDLLAMCYQSRFIDMWHNLALPTQDTPD